MIITVITVGKKSNHYYTQLMSEYEKRVKLYADVRWQFIPNSDIQKESKEILQKVSSDAYTILFDENGQSYDNAQLANILHDARQASRNVTLIIGGAYGVADSVKSAVNAVVSLSNLVFPHQLVRLIVAEQLYRSFTILSGHPYHHK